MLMVLDIAYHFTVYFTADAIDNIVIRFKNIDWEFIAKIPFFSISPRFYYVDGDPATLNRTQIL